MTPLGEAWAAAALFSLLVATIEITSKSRISLRNLPRGSFYIYLAILMLGNIVATGAASATPPVIAALPAWLWDAFVGVFGFEVVIQNLNVSFKGSGVLTISDWINKARDAAVADAIDAHADEEQLKVNALAESLSKRDLTTLNTYLVSFFPEPDIVTAITSRAQSENLDERLYKALALATRDYRKASQISLH